MDLQLEMTFRNVDPESRYIHLMRWGRRRSPYRLLPDDGTSGARA